MHAIYKLKKWITVNNGKLSHTFYASEAYGKILKKKMKNQVFIDAFSKDLVSRNVIGNTYIYIKIVRKNAILLT